MTSVLVATISLKANKDCLPGSDLEKVSTSSRFLWKQKREKDSNAASVNWDQRGVKQRIHKKAVL